MDSTSRPRITRVRELRACIECRRRKLKCDRHFPCTACARRNDVKSCAYERNNAGLQNEHERRVQAEARLEHLEQLVQQLSQAQPTSANGGISTSTTHSVGSGETDNQEETTGSINREAIYNGSTHWSAMLEDIEELRSTIAIHDSPADADIDPENEDNDGTSFLFGANRPMSYQDILLEFLPSRWEADSKGDHFFN
jgi:hypothetical protein